MLQNKLINVYFDKNDTFHAEVETANTKGEKEINTFNFNNAYYKGFIPLIIFNK